MVVSNNIINQLQKFCEEHIQTESKVTSIRLHPSRPVDITIDPDTGVPITVPVYGEYIISTRRNEIVLYYNNIPTLELFVHTFIHEYVHSTQDMDEYYRIYSESGIADHPYETSAEYLADLYTPIALQYLNLKDETRIQH